MKKLTKKQKNIIFRILIVLVLAVFAWVVAPEGDNDNNKQNGNQIESVADNDVGDGETDGSDKNLNDESDKDSQDGSDEKIEGNGDSTWVEYEFRKDEYLEEHFEKHGDEFDYTSAEEYLEGANRVLNSDGLLHKKEAEDGDDVYYLESSNELVIVAKDGYIRTYFKPSDGLDYFNRQ